MILVYLRDETGAIMEENQYTLQPVTHITMDAIGPAGKRVFYLQGRKDQQVITLILEKVQVQSISLGAEQFLDELQEKFPQLERADDSYVEAEMRIHPPVDPLFRIGELGLGYDVELDQILVIAKELVAEAEEGQQPEEAHESEKEVRFWCSRSQLRAMCKWGGEVAARGRAICPQCGEPMDPAGHFCPKRNGHKH